MKPNLYPLLNLWRPQTRRNLVSALVGGLLLILGLTEKVSAAPDGDKPPGYVVTISVIKDHALADNIQQDYVLVTVTLGGVPVNGLNVTFSSNGVNPVLQTNSFGQVTLALSNTVAGPQSVQVFIGGASFGTTTVNFIAVPGPPDPAASIISVISSPATANGIATDMVQVHLVDIYGNPIGNQNVTFSILSGTANFLVGGANVAGPVTVTTDVNGNYLMPLNSLVAGNVVVQANYNGSFLSNGSGGNSVTVVFVADVPSVTASLISVVSSPAIANGVATDVVKVHLVDAHGNPVSGQNVVFSIQSGTANFVVGGVNTPGSVTVTTDINGDYTISLNSVVAGNVVVQAAYNGSFISNGSGGNSVTVVFVADVPSASASLLSVVSSPATANGVATDVVKVHLVDAHGNPVSGQNVVFSIQSGTANFIVGGVNNPGPVTVTTDVNGDFTIALNSLVAGNVVVQAAFNGSFISNGSGGNSVTVVFVADVPSVTASLISVVTSPATANGIATDVVKVHLVDAHGNPVSGQNVVFSIQSGTANFVVGGANAPSPVTVTTDANGDYTIDLNSLVAGNVVVQAAYGGSFISNGSGGNSVTVVFVADVPSVTASLISVVSSPATANGVATDVVKVHLVDAHGNPVSGQNVVFSIQSGTANFVVGGANAPSPVTVTTDANGDYTIDLNSLVAGNVVVQAAYNGSFISNGSGGNSVTVVFVADVPSVSTSLISVVSSPATANGVATDVVKVHLVDAHGNPVSGQNVVFSIQSGTANFVVGGANAPSPVTVTTDANGDYTINLNSLVVGNVVVQASYGGSFIPNSSGGTSVTVAFTADVPSVSASLISVVSSPATADGIATDVVKVHLVDAHGNPVSGNVVFSIQSGTANFVVGGSNAPSPVTVMTDANGDYTISLNSLAVGNVVVQAAYNGSFISNGGTGNSVTVVFIAGAPTPTGGKTALIIITNNVAADGISSDSLHAFITDAQGHPVPNQTVTFTIEAGGTSTGPATFNESATVTTDANGIAAIGLTNTVAGTVNIGAYLNGPNPITGSAQTVTFVNAPDVNNPQTQLVVVIYEAIANGLGNTVVKAYIVDQYGNPIADQNVVFAIDSGTATIVTPGPWITDNNGEVSITLTSKTPGNVYVTATVGGKAIKFGSPAKVKFAAINIYVPRVFTPNGDGVNDVLKPILVGISTFHYFSVYNRWGNLIYTTEDPNQGWDGKFKGVAQPVETYLWVGEGIDTEGNKVVQKGMVSLVR